MLPVQCMSAAKGLFSNRRSPCTQQTYRQPGQSEVLAPSLVKQGLIATLRTWRAQTSAQCSASALLMCVAWIPDSIQLLEQQQPCCIVLPQTQLNLQSSSLRACVSCASTSPPRLCILITCTSHAAPAGEVDSRGQHDAGGSLCAATATSLDL
jgi:hypothetical protein